MPVKDNLRITFIAGGLTKGGAEKQFLYMLRALQEAKATIQVITFTRGEVYEADLRKLGIQPIFAGARPIERIRTLIKETRRFRPHFIQSSHFYSSFYTGIVGRMLGITSIGAVRSDLHYDMQKVGWLGPLILRLPDVLLANSNNARENARQARYPTDRVHVLHNVIDLETFDRTQAAPSFDLLSPDPIYAITVARLVPVKRMERFLKALEYARRQVPNLVGVIVGDGPAMPELRNQARALGLQPELPSGGARFLGERDDIPQLLAQADIFVLTSDREGFPNAILEAMAASLPIVTTRAGETPDLVAEGVNGFFVPFEDHQMLAKRLVELAQSPSLRKRLGSEGRQISEQQYGYPRLKKNLFEVYRAIAVQVNNKAALSILNDGIPPETGKVSTIPERRFRRT